MLYLIGLGIGGAAGITVEGLKAARKCSEIYIDSYTSVVPSEHEIRSVIGKVPKHSARNMLEEDFEKDIMNKAKSSDIALLIPGDPLVATTHIELINSCRKHSVKYKIIHSSSIISAIGETGLQSYKIGRKASIAFPVKGIYAESGYDAILDNKKIGLHTLLLLDLHNGKYMDCEEATQSLIFIEKKRKKKLISGNTMVVVCAALGSENSVIKYCKVSEVRNLGLKNGPFPQCIVLPGKLHFAEQEALEWIK